jgi:hypothetical protein
MIRIYICLYIYAYIYVHVNVYIYMIHIYLYVYICMYTYVVVKAPTRKPSTSAPKQDNNDAVASSGSSRFDDGAPSMSMSMAPPKGLDMYMIYKYI